jgi:hypothetical protein
MNFEVVIIPHEDTILKRKQFIVKLHLWRRSSEEANNRSASQEIPRLLWNPNAHYRVHNSTSPVHILSQMNPMHNFKVDF